MKITLAIMSVMTFLASIVVSFSIGYSVGVDGGTTYTKHVHRNLYLAGTLGIDGDVPITEDSINAPD